MHHLFLECRKSHLENQLVVAPCQHLKRLEKGRAVHAPKLLGEVACRETNAKMSVMKHANPPWVRGKWMHASVHAWKSHTEYKFNVGGG